MTKYEKDFKEVTGFDFEKYYNEYCPKLTWYLASKYTKDVEKAEDFANQAFMQALEKIDTYNKDKSKLITWLTKIAINKVIKEWKDSHKYNFISLERDSNDGPNIINFLGHDDHPYNAIHDEENKKKCEIVYDVIEKLPEKYKKVMVMRELEHMTYKDIADTIKKSTRINLNNTSTTLNNPEDFFSLDVDNIGDEEIEIYFRSENFENEFVRVLMPGSNISITRDEIYWERTNTDKFEISSESSVVNLVYITTTNLSTIKSQIKKGRELIRKKSDRKFKRINDIGVEDN